jgi:hypothetical protein
MERPNLLVGNGQPVAEVRVKVNPALPATD